MVFLVWLAPTLSKDTPTQYDIDYLLVADGKVSFFSEQGQIPYYIAYVKTHIGF